jgi:hypothetical protein
MCRKPTDPLPDGTPGNPSLVFQLCVSEKNSAGKWVETQLTTVGKVPANTKQYLGPSWSPDGTQILFNRAISQIQQMFRLTLKADGICFPLDDSTGLLTCSEQQLTFPTDGGAVRGSNTFSSWGLLRHVGLTATPIPTLTATATPTATATRTSTPTP